MLLGSNTLMRGGSNINYKELLTQILSNTLPPNSELELSLTSVRKQAFASLDNLKSITINDLISSTNLYLFQGSSVEEVIFPDITYITNYPFYQCSNLKIIRTPKLSNNMSNMLYIGTSVLSDVYITESTCSQILSIPGFPGMTSTLQNSNYANIVFHGSDGTVTYDGTDWVINSN